MSIRALAIATALVLAAATSGQAFATVDHGSRDIRQSVDSRHSGKSDSKDRGSRDTHRNDSRDNGSRDSGKNHR